MKNDKKIHNIGFINRTSQIDYLNSHITIYDNRKVVIEKCRQIIECNEILSRVITPNYEIEVWGNDLKMSNYCTQSVEVTGTIQTININVKKERID